VILRGERMPGPEAGQARSWQARPSTDHRTLSLVMSAAQGHVAAV